MVVSVSLPSQRLFVIKQQTSSLEFVDWYAVKLLSGIIFDEDIPSPNQSKRIVWFNGCGVFEHLLTESKISKQRDRLTQVLAIGRVRSRKMKTDPTSHISLKFEISNRPSARVDSTASLPPDRIFRHWERVRTVECLYRYFFRTLISRCRI